MDQENHTWNGAATGNFLLVEFIFSVQWTQIMCQKRLIIAKWGSWNFYGISTKVYFCLCVNIPQKVL